MTEFFRRAVIASSLLCMAGLAWAQDATKAPPKAATKAPVKDAKDAEPADPAAKEAARIAKWEPQIAAFETADAKSPPAPGGIVFVGSSSIRMWKLPNSFGELPALNRGFGGSQLADTVHYFDRLVVKHKPRAVVVYAGDNDLAGGKSPEQLAGDFAKLIARCEKELPQAKLIYVGVKPSLARWKNIEKVREANRLMRELAAKHSGVTFVDVDPAMLGEDGTPRKELFIKDGLHMTDAGYEIWTKLLKPHLTEGAK